MTIQDTTSATLKCQKYGIELDRFHVYRPGVGHLCFDCGHVGERKDKGLL